jgi:hypothetical protein
VALVRRQWQLAEFSFDQRRQSADLPHLEKSREAPNCVGLRKYEEACCQPSEKTPFPEGLSRFHVVSVSQQGG